MSEQCECEISTYHPFRMGGYLYDRERCTNAATNTVSQKSDGDTMYLCDNCLVAFKKLNEGDEALYEFKADKDG
jgi:predicted nucleic acid-binding Zn ribbon protein